VTPAQDSFTALRAEALSAQEMSMRSESGASDAAELPISSPAKVGGAQNAQLTP
jgi:hypothetical protein